MTTIHDDLETIRTWAQFLGASRADDELLTAASRLWASVHCAEDVPEDVRRSVRELADRFDGNSPEDAAHPVEEDADDRDRILALAARLNGDAAVGAC